MTWFKNLKVSAKLLTGFIFVAFVAMLMGIFSYSKISQINSLNNNLSEKQIPNILYLGNMNTNLNAVGAIERGLLNNGFTRRNLRKSQYEAYSAKLNNLLKNFDLYKANKKDEKEENKWQEYLSFYNEWQGLREKFFELNKEKDDLIAQGLSTDDTKITAMDEDLLTTYINRKGSFRKM